MFTYFPDNYGWSLSVLIAIACGGEISEIAEICRPLTSVAGTKERDADRQWLRAWTEFAARVEDAAHVDCSAGHSLTASRKYLRAGLYHLIGERQCLPKDEETESVYLRGIDAFRRGAELSDVAIEFLDVPFGRHSLPSLFVAAQGTESPAPCVIHFDGLDVMKEIIYLLQTDGLARRGVSLLICDHPGVGAALRLNGLRATHQVELPAAACVDYLSARDDVDSDSIGIMALSLGGYYAPRAAAFDPRLKCCVAWGAIWDLDACWENCEANGTGSVRLEDQLKWVTGLHDLEALRRETARFNLEHVANRIQCPLLVVHGANDRQAPLWTAERTVSSAVNSRRAQLRVFTLEEGGAEHCQLDNVPLGVDFMHDWIAEVLGAVASAAETAGLVEA